VDVSSDEELKQMLKPVMAEQLETKLKREIE
jgi:hypothetical protein